jgi:hypothetical protein
MILIPSAQLIQRHKKQQGLGEKRAKGKEEEKGIRKF